MDGVKTELKKALVSFVEVKPDGTPFFMTRAFKEEERAKTACSTLLNSGRKVSDLELKLIFKVKKEEKINERRDT